MGKRTSWAEVGVVFAIVAVLAVMLRPAWQVWDEQNDLVVCLGNLKSVGLACLQYAQDYDEKLPMAYRAKPSQGWREIVRPYMRVDDAYACPVRQVVPKSSYGYNGFYLDYRKTTSLRLPSSTVLFCDAGRRDDGTEVRAFYQCDPPSRATYKGIVRPDWRHLEQQAVVGYSDGHVKASSMGAGSLYPRTKSVGGNWKGTKSGPSRKHPPAIDALWSGQVAPR